MIRRIEALNFRSLRHVDVPLGRRQVLVGPNGSGKSSLIAAFTFLRDLVRKGPAAAVARHAGAVREMARMGSRANVGRNGDAFRDLVRGRPEVDPRFELAIELELPEEVRDQLPAEKGYRTYRYEVAVGGARKVWASRRRRGSSRREGKRRTGIRPICFRIFRSRRRLFSQRRGQARARW